MRPEPLTKWVVFATVALQVCVPPPRAGEDAGS